MEAQKILSKFDGLIDEAKVISKERDENIKASGESIISPVGYYRLLSSIKALFSYLNTTTYNDMIEEYCAHRVNPGILQGILESSRREFSFGLLTHPRMLVTADTMEDLLQQADYLLENEYKDAACVLVGGVLEGVLRSMLENKYPSIQFNPKDGLRKFNELLYKNSSAYDKTTFKLIDGYAELRNCAAHGNYTLYTKNQVEEFILFTRNFITNWFSVRITTPSETGG